MILAIVTSASFMKKENNVTDCIIDFLILKYTNCCKYLNFVHILVHLNIANCISNSYDENKKEFFHSKCF